MSTQKKKLVDWSAFTTDLVGNTAGWQMYGNSGTREVSKGAEPDFIINMTVSPPTTFVAAEDQAWQMYSAFSGWDNTETAVSDVNLLVDFVLQGDAKVGWTTNTGTSKQFCSTKRLDSIKTGGFSAVKLVSTGDCVNAWDLPTCSYGFNSAGRSEATCEISRDFTYTGAKQLSVGMPYTFQVGFNVWKDLGSGSTTKPLAAGTSVAMTGNLIEGASSLALTAAAAVIVTLSF